MDGYIYMAIDLPTISYLVGDILFTVKKMISVKNMIIPK